MIMSTIRNKTRGRKIRNMPRSSNWGQGKSRVKVSDTQINMAVDTATAVTLLNGLGKGTDLNQRVGQTVRNLSLEFHCNNAVTAATGIDQSHRVIVVWDKQPNGAALTYADVMDGGTTGLQDYNQIARFNILLDKLIYLNATGEAGSARVWSKKIVLNRLTHFNAGNAGTIADIVTGSIYIIASGSAGAGATAGGITGYCRLLFSD
jgi:hypothetical protein